MIILIRFIAGVVTAGIISLFGFTSIVNAATLLFSDGFESGNLSKWSYSGDEISGAQVHSGTKALHYDGWPGTEVRISSTRDVFLKLWWYFPPDFDGGWASGRHFWRFRTGVGQSQIDTQAQAKPNGFTIAYLGMGSNGAGWYPNAAQLPKGRWFKLEFYSRLNSPGVANGETALWIDGVQKLRDQNVILTNNNNGFNLFQLTTNYASTGGCPSNLVCDWYMDDVEVWNGCPPGSPCGGRSTTEPPTEEPPTEAPPLPDVIVTSLSYASGIFTSTVKNQGTAATPAGKVIGVGYSVDGVHRTWGTVATPPLLAGQSATVGTNGGSYTIPTGTHTITAFVDDVNRFAESDETNNRFSRSITVP